MINGIEHLGIYSDDTKTLKDWYIKMFDFKEVYDNGRGTYFLKAADCSMIEFVTASEYGEVMSDKANGLRHVALAVEDFDSAYKALIAEEVEVVVEPMIDDEKGIKTFFFRDIDGNVLHLIYRRDKF